MAAPISIGGADRVGGRGHNDRQKNIGARVLKQLAQYQQAAEFSHFGSELALEAKKDLEMGKRLRELFTQAPGESYSLMSQQLLFESVMGLEQGAVSDIPAMKNKVNEISAKVTDDEGSFDKARQALAKDSVLEVKR